jgi:hypothetical protein
VLVPVVPASVGRTFSLRRLKADHSPSSPHPRGLTPDQLTDEELIGPSSPRPQAGPIAWISSIRWMNRRPRARGVAPISRRPDGWPVVHAPVGPNLAPLLVHPEAVVPVPVGPDAGPCSVVPAPVGRTPRRAKCQWA